MNRVIKFRAWDKDKNRWHKTGSGFSIHWLGALIDGETNTSFPLGEEDRFVVMQSTGLKDKNGKEIWRGDIVNSVSTSFTEDGTDFEAKCEVCWCNECAGFHLMGFFHDSLRQFNSLEVIGNIYDNPKLLK